MGHERNHYRERSGGKTLASRMQPRWTGTSVGCANATLENVRSRLQTIPEDTGQLPDPRIVSYATQQRSTPTWKLPFTSDRLGQSQRSAEFAEIGWLSSRSAPTARLILFSNRAEAFDSFGLHRALRGHVCSSGSSSNATSITSLAVRLFSSKHRGKLADQTLTQQTELIRRLFNRSR